MDCKVSVIIREAYMRKRVFLLLAWILLLSTSVSAQKLSKYQESYNFIRAIEILTDDGDQNEAMDYLMKEVAEHPKNGYAYYVISSLYQDNDMPENALEPANKAIPLLNKDKEYLSSAYQLRAQINLALGNDNGALSDWNLSLKANPKETETYSDRAEYYYIKDMYDLSNADYEKICAIEPNNPLGYAGLGRNYIIQEKYNEAVDLFTNCIRLAPTNSQSYAFRAEAYMRLNRYNECVDDIIYAIDIDGNDRAYMLMQMIEEPAVNILTSKLRIQHNKKPEEGSWPYYLGVVYKGIGEYSKAIEAFKESAQIAPVDMAYGQIADCYDELGIFEMALDNIDMAIELDPSDDSYVGIKADLLYDMGRFDEAIETLNGFIKVNPEYYGGYYRRGFMKDNLRDVDGAIEDYTMAIVLEPEYAYAYLGRADNYLKKGNKTAALNDYKMVIQLDTITSESNCVQYAYCGLGEYEKAKSVQYAILANSPSPGNYYDAACLFSRMGEYDIALNFLKSSLEKGFHRFAHIGMDDDLDVLRGMDSYKVLIEEYEKKYDEELNERRVENGIKLRREEAISEIPFTVENGNCYVQCQINDLPMRFVFDTGASDVSISMVEATFMMKNGYLTNRDVIGSAKFSDAVGNVSEGTVINIKKVRFGDVELDNVRASVVRNQVAPLLLGQTVLSRIGNIEIDNQRKVIKVRYMKEIKE